MKVGKEIDSPKQLNRKIIGSITAAARVSRLGARTRGIIRAGALCAILLNILAFPVNVSYSGLQASLAQGSVEVWWPQQGARVSGVQPFKAMVSGLDNVSEYDMYWSVDGGQENRMDNSSQDYPHKESQVDLKDWTWRGQGPYEVSFVAKKGGVVVARSSVTIYNDAAPVASPDEQNETAEPQELASTNLSLGGESGENDAAAQESGQALEIKPAPAPALALYVDPQGPAARQAREWRDSRPADAARMDALAAQPTAKWLGGWSGNVEHAAREYAQAASGKVPVFVAYNVPQRDCGGYSAGGVGSKDEYLRWIGDLSRGIGGSPAVVILEPDALAGMGCLSHPDQERRMEMLASAVSILKSNGSTKVYVDAGHNGWTSPREMAERLKRAGLAKADGFSLNVSNFMPTDDERRYGKDISEQAGGAHFVIDTSRNGNGSNGEWCNPWGRKVGESPTLSTGNSLVDAYLWIKTPGESDGTCNGGPSAGTWWPDYALSLVR